MNEITVINESIVLGEMVRIYGTPDNPLFLAKDVAEWIEHSNARMMLQTVDDSEKQCVNNPYALQGQQEQWFITEDGLYELLMQSRKPKAKDFKAGVKAILKSIRKTGGFISNDEQFINTYLPFADNATKSLFEMTLRTVRQQNELIEMKEKQLESQKTKVLFADAVSASSSSILIGDLAKLLRQNGYETGQKRLFEQMRSDGYLMKSGASMNMPTQYAMERGWLEVKETSISNPDGSVRVTKTTKVTGKGQQFFLNKYLESNQLFQENEQDVRDHDLPFRWYEAGI